MLQTFIKNLFFLFFYPGKTVPYEREQQSTGGVLAHRSNNHQVAPVPTPTQPLPASSFTYLFFFYPGKRILRARETQAAGGVLAQRSTNLQVAPVILYSDSSYHLIGWSEGPEDHEHGAGEPPVRYSYSPTQAH